MRVEANGNRPALPLITPVSPFACLGQNVVFRRQEQQQRFALPYQVTVERVSAVYDAQKDEGTLTLIMTKPTVAASGSPVFVLTGLLIVVT